MASTSTLHNQNDELSRLDAYWRACNYLAAGMIYLRDNPLLRQPLAPEHIKKRLLGHWGSSPGLSFVYVHMNRVINKYDLKSNRDYTQSAKPLINHGNRCDSRWIIWCLNNWICCCFCAFGLTKPEQCV